MQFWFKQPLKGHSFGTVLTWTLVFSLWKDFTPTLNQSTSRLLLQSLYCFAWFSIICPKTCFECALAHPKILFLSYLVKYSMDRSCLWDMHISYEMVSNAHVRCQLTASLQRVGGGKVLCDDYKTAVQETTAQVTVSCQEHMQQQIIDMHKPVSLRISLDRL